MTRKAAIYALLTAGALLMTFPFVWMVSTALKSEAEALLGGLDLFPARPMWSNFVVMFQEAPQFATYFYNSFVVAFAVTASVLVTSMFAGYTFARLDFPGRGLLFSLVGHYYFVFYYILLAGLTWGAAFRWWTPPAAVEQPVSESQD